MIAIMLAIALSASNHPPIVVDRLEVNTFPAGPDSTCKQVILWRWMRTTDGPCYRVADWWIVDNNYEPVTKVVSYTKGDVIQEIWPKSIAFTKTPYDPELRDRRDYPEEMRRSYLTQKDGE